MGQAAINIPENHLASLLTIFSSKGFVERVILFGSRARGDHEERSDIDLAIDAEHTTERQWFDLCEEMRAITLLKLDIVRMDEASTELLDRIESEGKPIYDRR